MNWIQQVVALVSALAWPVTVLVIFFYFRSNLREIVQHATSKLIHSRSVHARFGAFEVDLDTVERLQQKAEEIAEETDPAKRLQKAKAALLAEQALRGIDEADLDTLREFHGRCLRDSFLVNWYQVTDEERKALMKFQNDKMLGGYDTYGDSVMWFTPLGLQVIKTLGIESSSASTPKAQLCAPPDVDPRHEGPKSCTIRRAGPRR